MRLTLHNLFEHARRIIERISSCECQEAAPGLWLDAKRAVLGGTTKVRRLSLNGTWEKMVAQESSSLTAK